MPREKIYPDEEVSSFNLRVPEKLREIIDRRARKNRRSRNQEIVWLIEKALQLLNQEQRPEEE